MPPKTQKKSGKGKEKKLKRKQEQAELAIAWEIIKKANDVVDYMEYFVPFKNFNRNGLQATVSYTKCDQTSHQMLQWMFQLLKRNMESLYRSSGLGWNDREKYEELTHESSRFIVVKDSSSSSSTVEEETSTSSCLGFVSLRFDMDDNIEVLYCYEIQLTEEARRKGLGKFMMQLVELIGHKANMRKVVATVFKDNIGSNRFFREKLGYIEDDTSPSLFDPLNSDDYSYSIISKGLYKPVKSTNTITDGVSTTHSITQHDHCHCCGDH